jgi:hypothetical protein
MTMWLETSQRWLKHAVYRVRQFLVSLWPQVTAEQRALADTWLPAHAAPLFERMSQRDQWHSLNVLARVQQAEPDQVDLFAAALLHDVAKTVQPGQRLQLYHRVLVVLMEAARPGWVRQAAHDDINSWRYPFYLHLHHPELGARLAEQAGCSPLTVELIRRHQDRLTHAPRDETERLLALLQAADDAS